MPEYIFNLFLLFWNRFAWCTILGWQSYSLKTLKKTFFCLLTPFIYNNFALRLTEGTYLWLTSRLFLISGILWFHYSVSMFKLFFSLSFPPQIVYVSYSLLKLWLCILDFLMTPPMAFRIYYIFQLLIWASFQILSSHSLVY